MMDSVINPLVVIERHNEAVFYPFYAEGERKGSQKYDRNELIIVCL